jgi:hypothetical protein
MGVSGVGRFDFASKLETYFLSDIYRNLGARRQEIRDYANTVHSWDVVADWIRKAYAAFSGKHPS